MKNKEWGPGPWDDEPDRAEWRDEATGRPCLAVRNSMGAWCGYVAVDPGHPLCDGGRDDLDLDVHGGVTYAGKCNDHVCHTPLPGEPADVTWIGFDCGHCGDLMPLMRMRERELDAKLGRRLASPYGKEYRTLDYVRTECAKLAAQVVALG